MKRPMFRSAVILLVLCFIAAAGAQASQLNYTFPSLGAFYFSATNGSGFVSNYGQMPSMWTAGDFVTQTYFGGPAVADSASFFFYVKDYLNGYTETVDIFINGFGIDSFTIPDVGGVPTLLVGSGLIPFSPINGGGTYNYSFVLQDTIPGGGGSVAFYATPEPGSIALFGSGILGIAGIVRRRFRV